VLAGGEGRNGRPPATAEELHDLAQQMSAQTDPMGPAGIMALDEIIDPAETRRLLAEQVGRLVRGRRHESDRSILSTWPTCW